MGKENLGGNDPSEPTSLDNKRAQQRAEIEDLIERSSLGTPAAKAIRARTPQHVVDRVLARVRELMGTPDATVTPITSAKGKRRKKP